MNKIFKALATTALGLALALGVGVGVASGVRTDEVNAASGDTYTFSATSGTSTDEKWSFTTAKNSGSSAPAYTSGQLRLYPSNSITFTGVTGVTINSASFTCVINANKKGTKPTGWSTNKGTIDTYGNTKTSFNVQSISANSFTITIQGSAGNVALKTVSVSYTEASESIPLTDIGLPSTASVQVGSTTTLTPIKTPTNANKNDTLSWESLDPTYASVNQSGVVTGIAEGTARIRVNATDIGKSATCTVTVNPIPPVPVTHTIAQCYTVATGTDVKFNGVYMGAYGNNPYQGIFFADGESGIMIYQVSSVPSTWEVGKTVVAVSGKTALYNGLVQITGASFELTTATVATPVVYTFLGNETTNTILSRKSSISGTVTAVTGQTDGAFVTGTDGKVTIDLGNESTALIFIKKGVFSSQELNTFTEAYKVGNHVVSTGFVGYYKSGQSKDSAYDPACWQIVVPSVVSVGKYGAVEFAQDFLTDTDTICSSGSNDNLTALQAMWADTAAKYTALTSEERQKLADSSATDTDIVGAIARYKYICGKYNTDEVINLQEYIEGVIVIHNAPNVFFGVNSTDNNTMMIVIISVAVASISLLGVTIFLKKKRAIH